MSVSEYVERFTLKGGIFLYALFNGNYARATVDIDLLAQHIPNDADEMKKVFENIFAIECDDALHFDLGYLDVINITEFKEYHGVNVSVTAYLDKTRVPVSIGLANGRYKDFYDIVAFEEGFTEDSARQSRWNSFIKKKKAMVKVEFKEVIDYSK